MNFPFWQKHAYRYAILTCGLFVLLTVIAMFTYPGGTYTGESTSGYDFFRNFFSDLGRIRVMDGTPNTVSLVLFFLALVLAGSGLIVFFIAFRAFFPANRTAALLGTVCGVAAGLCFIGVAFTPYDLFLDAHIQLVFWAFRTYLAAVGLYAFVIFRQHAYPRRYGWIFVAFAVCLAAYIILLEFGPSAKTPAGLIIQATGQKAIVYISILSAMAQAWLASRFRNSTTAAATTT